MRASFPAARSTRAIATTSGSAKRPKSGAAWTPNASGWTPTGNAPNASERLATRRSTASERHVLWRPKRSRRNRRRCARRWALTAQMEASSLAARKRKSAACLLKSRKKPSQTHVQRACEHGHDCSPLFGVRCCRGCRMNATRLRVHHERRQSAQHSESN